MQIKMTEYYQYFHEVKGPFQFPISKVFVERHTSDLLKELQVDVSELVKRHGNCDWGMVSEREKAVNDAAIISGGVALSKFNIGEESDPLLLCLMTDRRTCVCEVFTDVALDLD